MNFVSKLKSNKAIIITILSLFGTYLAIEIFVFSRWIQFFSSAGPLEEIVDPFFTGYSIFWQQFGYSIPRMLFVFLVGWLIFILYATSFKRKEFLLTAISLGYTKNIQQIIDKRKAKGLLLVACAIALFVSVVPYLPTINPNGNPVGVDYPVYQNATKTMIDSGPEKALSFAMTQDRPLVIILFYFLSNITHFNEIFKIAPLILSLANTVSLYFLVGEISSNKKIAGIAAIIETVSLHTIVGIGAGFYANWLAFAVLNVSLFFIIRAMKTKRLSMLIAGSVILSSIILIHAWTWFFILAVFIVFAITNLISNKIDKRSSIIEKSDTNNRASPDISLLVKFSAILITINLGVDLCIYLLAPGSGSITSFNILVHQSGTEAGFRVLQYFKITNVFSVDLALSYSFGAFLGGALASFLLLSLSFFGIGARTRYSLISYRLIVSWLIISIFGIIFSPIEPIEFLFMWTQSRFIYFLPLSILASVGIVSLEELLVKKLYFTGYFSNALKVVLYGAVILNLLNTVIEKLVLYVRA